MTRLLCVEDDPLMRAYLATRLAVEPDIEVVSAVAHARSALIYLRHEEIDVILLDYQLDEIDGWRFLEVLADWYGWPHATGYRPAVLFCTGYADEAFEAKARAMGASGVVAKTQIAAELVPALRAVAAGGRWFGGERCDPATW